MALLIRRSKVVSVRMSDDEFRQLKELCVTTGARCVSDLARDTIFKLMNGGAAPYSSPPGALESRVQELDERLNHLQGRVSRLAMLVLEDQR